MVNKIVNIVQKESKINDFSPEKNSEVKITRNLYLKRSRSTANAEQMRKVEVEKADTRAGLF